MATKRTQEPWMPADDYGRGLPDFTVNLLVADVARSVEFYREVFGATVHHSDADFAALRVGRIDFMVHADHAYDHHRGTPNLLAACGGDLARSCVLFNVDPGCSGAARGRLGAREFCRRRRISRMVGAT